MSQVLKKLICNIAFFAFLFTFSSAQAQNYIFQFNITGFNGLTINSPATIHENPNNPLHSQTALLTITPTIAEDVLVTVTTNTLQCTVSGSPLLLAGTTVNPTTSGTVTFTAVNDGINEPFGNVCNVTYSLTSTNPLYNGTTLAAITIIDWNPTVIIENIVQIDENPLAFNHSNNIRVRLTDQPSADVTLVINFDNNQIDLSPNTITFNSSNWNTGIFVNTTADTDNIAEPTPHFTTIVLNSTSGSAIEFANRSWSAIIPIADYTITVPVIIRTGATQVLPVLAFASFVMILVYFFVISNRDKRYEELHKTTIIE